MNNRSARDILDIFRAAAGNSLGYAKSWREKTGKPVIGSFPMHFPSELALAAGALPVIIQESDEAITDGESAVFSFYCGYNRSVVDQAVKGRLDFLDGIMFGDHCVQLLGTADVIRMRVPHVKILFNQLISSMNADWAWEESRHAFVQLRSELEELLDVTITDEQITNAILLLNRNRALIRRLYHLRTKRRLSFSARDLQDVVKSSMVMDRAEHTELLEALVALVEAETAGQKPGMPVYISGHLCQAPKTELLDLIEECGVTIVGDDVYHGYRFVHTDVPEDVDPLAALASWYMQRNVKVPCPTRVDTRADWDSFLIDAVAETGAYGLIVLVAKFCEPHMYYYPEIHEKFLAAGVPILKIETEHDSMPFEAFRTRIETFVEVAQRRQAAA